MSAARPIHFISGLPRSGSTLLAAILRQNPALHAGMSSPLASLVLAMQRAMSQENEGAPFIDDAQREAVLRGVVEGFHAGQLAGVLNASRDTTVGLLITDPTASSPGGGPSTHDTLLLRGITKGQLAKYQYDDINLHA